MIKALLRIVFLSLIVVATQAQSVLVKGRLTSATEPAGLPGVNVVVKGTAQGSITDGEGRYTLDVPPGATLIYSFVGFQTQEIVYQGQSILDVVLKEESTELNEVVVVGYTTLEKRDITGAVSSVKTNAFKDLSVNGIDQALQGQAAGVQVTQSSGTPGGGVSVRIRGATSIFASNSPLYIVDGIPVSASSLSQRDFGGQNDNALSLISPNDIESITVLKDASAKAQYGARASNGVVLITTKRGKSGKTDITFDVQRGLINATHKIDLLNAKQLLELQREAVINAGQNPDALGLIPGVTDATNTDWQNEVLRTGIMQQYQLSMTGGDDITKFYMSLGYRDEEGIQLNNRFSRLNGSLNIDRKISQKFSLSTNLTLSRGFNKRVKGDNFLDGVYSGALKSLPYDIPYDESGRLIGPSSPSYAGFPNFNPVAQALLPRFNTQSVKLLGGLIGNYQINPNFRVRIQTSLDYNNVVEDQYESSQTAIGGYLSTVGGKGYGVYSTSSGSTFISNATVYYDRPLSDKASVHAFVGAELLQMTSTSNSVQGRLFPSDDFTYVTSAGIVDAGSSFKTAPHNIFSYLGEVRYNYGEKYMASASFRADGSSNFGPSNRFGHFPGASLAWRISEEPFFHIPFINDMKLRTSLGFTGNERINPFQFLALWSSSTYGGNVGVVPQNVANPNIRWEKTRELNVGIDISTLNGRIQTTAEVYFNKTSDLLMPRPYPFTTGFGSITSNIGNLQNRGVEFTATSVNLEGKVRWTTTLNLSRNVNKVTYLADTIPLYRGYSAEGIQATNIIKAGEPLGTFWGLHYLGVNPATGNAMYEDRNGDGKINNDDAMVIGNAQPKLFGGITNRFQYKNFDVSVFFQFSYGNKILNLSRVGLVNMGADLQTNQSTEALRRWRKPGDITDVPRYVLGSSSNNYHSDRLLEDGSYLRLKNLSMGYNLPARLTNRALMSRARIYISATNLLTFTKYTGSDPEVSTLDGSTSAQGIDFYTLPQVRTISLGLNATLK